MKRGAIVVAGVIALLALGATAQVTREEFQEAVDRIAATEKRCVMLGIRIKACEKQLRDRPVALIELPKVPPEPKLESKPLEGRDLQAWKLARAAAQDRIGGTRLPRRPISTGAAEAGSAAAYHAIAAARRQATTPVYRLRAEARTNCMTKTDTGDWIFDLPIDVKDPITRQVMYQKIARVTVVDYGTELRVEKTEIMYPTPNRR